MKDRLKLSGNIKLAAAGALLAFSSVLSSSGQQYDVTTVANFALTGFRQNGDGVTPVRMGNKDIIAALNASGFDFGSSAQIVMISLEDQLPTFGIREGKGANAVTTDISSFFRLTESDEIHTANNLTSYVVQDYQFDNHNGTTFSVSGLSTLKRGNISGPGFGPLDRVKQITSQVNGPGSMNGDAALFRGSMSSGSATAQVH